MSPTYHAEMSAKRFGGKPEDYIEIHKLMDSSKAAVADLRHRTLTHNSWFVTTILELIFGSTIKNSDDNDIPVREIGQFHVMEDFGGAFPTAQDFIAEMNFKQWMNNGEDGAMPPSNIGLPEVDRTMLYDPVLWAQKENQPKEDDSQKAEKPDKFKEFFDKTDEDAMFSRGCGGGGRLD